MHKLSQLNTPKINKVQKYILKRKWGSLQEKGKEVV